MSKWTFLFSFFLILFLSNKITAKSLENLDLFYEFWNTQNNLPHNTITDIQQTGDGYLWFSTWEGVSRYNGESFVTSSEIHGAKFTDSGSWVMNVDQEGNIYIGGAEGQIVKRDTQRQWEVVGNVKSQINEIIHHKHFNIIVATENGELHQITEEGNLRRLLEAKSFGSQSTLSLAQMQSEILIGTENGLKIYQDGDLRVDSRFVGYRINDLVLETNHLILATDRGTFKVSLSKDSEPPKLISSNPSTTLMTDSKGLLWVGTYRNGLYVYREGNQVKHYKLDTGLLDNRVLSIFEDKDKSIWVGTNGGLTRLRQSTFLSYGKRQGIETEFTRAVITFDDAIWAGTSGGLYKSDADLEFQRIVPNKSILSLAIFKSTELLIGTYASGLLVLKNGEVSKFFDSDKVLPSNEIRTLDVSPKGNIAIGTSNGLFLTDGDRNVILDESNGLKSDFISVVKFIGDRLWIGTSQGLYYLDQDGLSERLFDPTIGAVQIFDIKEGFKQNSLWIASSKGLSHYNINSSKFITITDFGEIPTQKILTINIDNQNSFWLSTNHGVLQIYSNEISRSISSGSLSINPNWFTEKNGMFSRQANGRSTPSAWIDRNSNRLWVATAKGISRANLNNDFSSLRIPPNPVFEAAYVSDIAQNAFQSIEVMPEQKSVRIDFASLDFILGEQVYYRARLLGSSRDWVNRERLNFVEFLNLNPGRYTFEVQASLDNQNWTESSKVEILKKPFWWQTNLAFALLLVTIFAFVVAIFWYRAKNAKQIQQKLEHQVRERTFELEKKSELLVSSNEEKTKLLEQLHEKSMVLEKLSAQDPLTELMNRRAFEVECKKELLRAKRSSSTFCICFIDIDHFKLINDNWSHHVGDIALVEISKIIDTEIRAVDFAARWGGEEFVLLLTGTDIESAIKCCERIRVEIENYDCSHFADNLSITISAGVTDFKDTDDVSEMLQRADSALYTAKQSGRNKVLKFEN